MDSPSSSQRACRSCGKTFDYVRTRGRPFWYCGVDCRTNAKRAAARERSREWLDRVRESDARAGASVVRRGQLTRATLRVLNHVGGCAGVVNVCAKWASIGREVRVTDVNSTDTVTLDGGDVWRMSPTKRYLLLRREYLRHLAALRELHEFTATEPGPRSEADALGASTPGSKRRAATSAA